MAAKQPVRVPHIVNATYAALNERLSTAHTFAAQVSFAALDGRLAFEAGKPPIANPFAMLQAQINLGANPLAQLGSIWLAAYRAAADRSYAAKSATARSKARGTAAAQVTVRSDKARSKARKRK